jgi:hypothetical protein
MGTGQTGVFTATLPLVGGIGTGQTGVATLPLVGGIGTGQTGVFTATLPLVGGMGTGHTGVATFPWGKAVVPGFEAAAAKVTEVANNATKTTTRKFSMDEFI